mgnify:CR=1 FL=1
MKHVFIINPTAGKADSRQKIYDMADALRAKHDLDVQCILTKKQGHATEIARRLGISESVIAITLVAGGTSLPELASSLVSLFKGKADMALGNVIGSNIANILLILGLSATIHPLSMGGITVWDLLMVVLSSVLLFLAAFTFKRRAIDRWEGAIFLAIYVAYIGYLIR